jgi:hypothetical protein
MNKTINNKMYTPPVNVTTVFQKIGNLAKVKVMHSSKTGAYYVWPTDEDCIIYKAKDIVKKIEPPEPYGGTRDYYKFKSIIGPLPDCVLP